MGNKQTPFYVVLSAWGPNNSDHPKYTKAIHYQEEGHQQYFKIIEVDDTHRGCGGNWATYLTEDGYCLWSGCVEKISQQEYEQNKNIVEIQEVLIFN